jgi:hypothetical protein
MSASRFHVPFSRSLEVGREFDEDLHAGIDTDSTGLFGDGSWAGWAEGDE